MTEGISKEQAVSLAWKTGRLRYKLDGNQRTMYDAIWASEHSRFYLNCARRIGKSFMLCVIAAEYALRYPGAEIKYAAPTIKNVKKIIRPHFRKIFKDCPTHLKPKYNTIDSEYVFPNGSTITVAGCENGNFESLRGTASHLNIVDEAGFIDELSYIISDVLAPMTMDTGGKTIIASTPPRSPGHESYAIAMELKEQGAYIHRTVFDNGRLSRDKIEAFIRQQAGSKDLASFMKTTTFRREYLAEFVVDLESAVIPEFDAQKKEELVKEVPRPPLCDTYVSLDVGWRDGMGALFAYWDFDNARLVLEDEWLKFKVTTAVVADAIKTKESTLWGHPPYLRIADNNLLLIHDLSSQHGLTFVPTEKDDKELQVNNLREWIAAGKIFIHPRCVRLIHQLETTIWNKQRSSYERSRDGHGDLLDALVYLVRNVRRYRNPHTQPTYSHHDYYVDPRQQNKPTGTGAAVLSMFRTRRPA